MTIQRSRAALAALVGGAVASAGLVGLAPAAVAAPVNLDFDCSISILSGQKFKLAVTPELPASAEVGKPVAAKFSGTVTVPNSTVSAAYAFLSVRSLSGKANVDAKFGPDAVALNADLPSTALPATGDLSVPVAGSGSWTPTTVGDAAVTISGFKAPLVMTKADKTTQEGTVDCKAADASVVVATVPVGPATTPPAPKVEKSKTTAKAKYSKAKKSVTASTKVTVKGKAAKGKVTITLKRGTKTVKSVTKSLKKGAASNTFKKVSKKGKYSVVVSFKGNATQAKSSKKATFTVR